MHTGIIIRRLDVRGGTQRQALALAQELKRRGHGITLYTFVYSPADCYSELLSDLPVISLYGPGERPRFKGGVVSFFKNYLQELRDARSLAVMINEKTDVLNPHDQEAYRVAAYFKKSVKNIPSVWMMNDMPTRTFSLWRDSQFDPMHGASAIRRIFNIVWDGIEVSRFISKQDAVAVLDERDKKLVAGAFTPRVSVVRSGIDAGEFPFRPHSPTAGAPIRIMATGILLPHRRYEDLIDACALLREQGRSIMLTIVGDYRNVPHLHASLVQRINRKGLFNKVSFKGVVSAEELQKLYATHDCFVFPCHLQSWGLAVFEAMASGMPVIVSRTAGASEVLTHEKNALLVDPFAPNQIADATVRLADDGALYARLSRDGRDFVEKNLSWTKYTDAMLKIFEEAKTNCSKLTANS